jgi:hypothetical protein
MSTLDAVNDACASGLLHKIEPLLEGRERRGIYLSAEVYDLLPSSWSDRNYHRFYRLRQDLDHFIQAARIVVAGEFRRAGSAYIGRLYPPSEEIWDIRSRDPNPALRLLGSFAAKDTFVVMTCEERKSLGRFESREWKVAIQRSRTCWRNMFPAYAPISGRYPDDYITGAILNRDS